MKATNEINNYYIRLTAFFPGQLGSIGTRILRIKKGHQLDHIQILAPDR